jgi:hypothetical protein
MSLAMFEAHAVVPPSVPPPGGMRAAEPSELDLLDAWLGAFSDEARVERRGRREDRSCT